MKNLLRLTTTFILLMFLGGNAWGQTTVSYDFADVGAVTGINEASPGIALDANIGFGSFKNSASTNPAIFSGQLRLYQNATKGGSIKIYASNGVTITQVIVHASGTTGPAAYTVDGGSATDLSGGTTYTMSSLSATSVVEFYQKHSSTRIYVDYFEVTYTSVASGPSITSITNTPETPTPTETASVSATITDADGVGGAEVHWGTTSGSLGTTIAMTNTSGDTYTTDSDIPVQSDGTTVYYEVYAMDNNSDETTSGEQSYTVTAASSGGGTEDFSNFPETGSSYEDGTFLGQDGSTWTYTACRGDQDITDETPCLRNTASSDVYSGTISGGIGTVNFDYMQAFSTNANLDILINDQVVGTVTSSGEEGVTKNSGSITVDVSGNFVLKFKQNTSPQGGQVSVDNVTWTGYSSGTGPDAPTDFSATASASDQIDLAWTENGDGNDVLIAWNTTNTFDAPVDGNTYASGVSIGSNGTSLGTDADEAFSHTSLTSNTPYYYKIWSVDGSTNYSSGVEENATTFADEPSSHPTGLGAAANSSSEITVTWTDAASTEHYLIKGSDVSYAAIVAPTDGVAESNSLLVQNVDQDVETHQFTSLSAGTIYYFKIFPYNGADATANYKTDGSVPEDDAETDAYSGPALLISEVADPADFYLARFIEIYNAGATTIDFSTTTVYLSRQANGIGWYDLQLTGSLTSKSKLVIASSSSFSSYYGVQPDIVNGSFDGNGNDAVFLYGGGDHTAGTLIDIYGAIDTNGDGEAWDYEDSKAVRKNTITEPNSTWTAAEWTIVSSCDAARMTPAMHPASAWNGDAAKSNVWTTAGNWDNGLTGSGISAHIPSGLTVYPTITATATIEDLRMGTGATLLGGEFLTINGTARVQKNIAGYTGEKDNYHIVASPLNGAALLGSDWAPVSGEDDFYVYDPAANIWRDYLDEINDPEWFNLFDVGQGYLVAYHPNNDGIKNIVATTINKDETYTFNLVFYATDSHNWNFVGNPYPSKIEFDGMVFSNAGSMKTMDVTDGSYDDVGTGDDIDICQGFIVYANSDPATVTIDRTDQTHSSAKKSGGEINRMKLIASSPERMVHVWLTVNETSTTNFEWQTDSRYLPPFTELPRLSMLTADEIEVSTNSFSITGESVIIPVKFSVLQDETITFSLEDFSNTLGVKDVILEDQLENTFTTLSDGDTFTYDAFTSDDPLRFKLHVNGAASINDPASSDWMNIYSAGSTIYLNSNKAQDATVNVYNNLGQIVASKQLNVDGLTSFDVNAQTGWYVVRVVADGNAVAKKVFIK